MSRGWINADESAKEMLGRVRKDRPTLYLPDPLNKVPIGVGDIVEIIGPSSSAKTEILLQMAINCILPGHCDGVHYGGLVHSVLFLDLDCRFEILRLSQSLKLRIIEAANRSSKMTMQPKDFSVSKSGSQDLYEDDNEDLFRECMRKFSCIRCYDSFQFLGALKLLHSKVLKEGKTHGPGVHVLMIDSIGAFYWMDRGFSSLPQGVPKRKNLSLQSVLETVVQEIKQLLQLHPMLVLVTRTAALGDRQATKQIKSSFPTLAPSTASEMKNGNGGFKKTPCREYMPSVWQSFVTHRILVRASDDERKLHDRASYLAEWLPPVPNLSEGNGKYHVLHSLCCVVLLLGEKKHERYGVWLDSSTHSGKWTLPTSFISSNSLDAMCLVIVQTPAAAVVVWILKAEETAVGCCRCCRQRRGPAMGLPSVVQEVK